MLALAGISLAAPLIRLSDAHPLAIAIWRLGFSLLIITGLLVPSRGWREWRRLDVRGLLVALGAGVMLALHFWSWNTSLRLTSVAASVVLVNLQPVIVGLLSAVWLREAPSRAQWGGIGLALLGAFVVAWSDLGSVGAGTGSRALLGDALAMAGAATAALYYLAGRNLRQTLDLWPYVGLVYGACFVSLVLLALIANVPVIAQPPREIAIFAALALGPMMLGHTGMNWALKYLPAFVVNLTVLGEPIGATLIAAFLPGIRDVPSSATLAGGFLVLGGMVIAMPRRSRI